MEFIARQEKATAAALEVDAFEFRLPSNLVRWSVHVLPRDSGGGGAPDDPSIDVKYALGADGFFSTNPASSAVAKTNKVNVITRDDSIGRIRVDVTQGATPPDGGVVVELYGTRSRA